MQKMNEKEAIEILRNTAIIRYEKETGLWSSLGDAMRTAIQALEEIQEYQAIGTVEEINEMMVNGWFTGAELAELAFMQSELKKYKSIGTLDQCREAVERMKPKKPKNVEAMEDLAQTYFVECHCGGMNQTDIKHNHQVIYCWKCGQAIDNILE